jgi:hypothetical protein
MSEAHEHAEHIEHISHTNKKIALMIAVLALFLALAETLGKSAQTGAISDNVEASNLWAFYQAKTIRMTQIRTAAEAMTIDVAAAADADVKSAMTRQIDTWQKTAARYDSDPETGEGRKELYAPRKLRSTAILRWRDTIITRSDQRHFRLASFSLRGRSSPA